MRVSSVGASEDQGDTSRVRFTVLPRPPKFALAPDSDAEADLANEISDDPIMDLSLIHI